MPYFVAKRDLDFAKAFRDSVHQLWAMEQRAALAVASRTGMFDTQTPTRQRAEIREEANHIPEYPGVRVLVARGVPRAIRLCFKHSVPITGQSFPPALMSGPVIPVNFMMVILDDNSWGGIDHNLIEDRLNQLIGNCEEAVTTAKWRLVNPLYWFYEALAFVLRIPFRLIELTGFNVNKIEDALIGKFFMFAELLCLIYLLVRLGATNEELRKFLSKFILK
jgi:hypothetical protein